MNKRILATSFYAMSLAFFSLLYFSFFPGRYSPDSYTFYDISLGNATPVDIIAPMFSLFWKVGGNYNFSPFIINYLLLLSSMLIIYHKCKSLVLPQVIALCFISPFFFLCYLFAWKDNALISVLLLLVAISIKDSAKSSTNSPYLVLVVPSLLILVAALRLNSIFAALPFIWFYLGIFRLKKQWKVTAFVISLAVVMGVNHFITYRLFDARKSTYIQQLYLTDIAKINYRLGEEIEVPIDFRGNFEPSNIDKVFKQYARYPSNDYFFYKLVPEFDPLFRSSENQDKLLQLKKLWLNKIMMNPSCYVKNRYEQWIKAMSEANQIFGANFNSDNIMLIKKHRDRVFYEPQNKTMSTIRGFYEKSIILKPKIMLFLYDLSVPVLYFVLDILFLVYMIINKKPTPNSRLLVAILLSGILYILGYLPILPAGDYRYFTWVILTFWLAVGLYINENFVKRVSNQ